MIHHIKHTMWLFFRYSVVFKTFPFHGPCFFGWNRSGFSKPWLIGGETMSKLGALVQSFSTFGNFIEGGDRINHAQLKTWKRCPTGPERKGLFFKAFFKVEVLNAGRISVDSMSDDNDSQVQIVPLSWNFVKILPGYIDKVWFEL